MKCERIRQSATLTVNAPVGIAFPLFGPVLEMKWAEGWSPEILYTDHEEISQHMIFKTKGDGEDYLWAVTRYLPEQHSVEYTVTAPQRIWFICVECEPNASDITSVKVTYTYTGFNELANIKNAVSLKKMFEHDLRDWQEAINRYLKTQQLQTVDN